MEVVINDALMVPCLRLYKLTSVHLPLFLSLLYAALSCLIIFPYPPLCLMFIMKNTHFKTARILKLIMLVTELPTKDEN